MRELRKNYKRKKLEIEVKLRTIQVNRHNT